MVRVERAVRIAASAATAWQVLRDFSAAEIAAGICTRIEVERRWHRRCAHDVHRRQPGATATPAARRSTSRNGSSRTTKASAACRTGWSMPARCHSPTTSAPRVLVCAGPDRCIAVMTSAFVPVEMTDEAAAALSRGSIDLALANLRAAAERRNAAVSA